MGCDQEYTAGATGRMIEILLRDATFGHGKTGLVHGDMACHYWREGEGANTPVDLSTGTLGTWSSGHFVECNGPDNPGLYQLGIPDAALAAGAEAVTLSLVGDGVMDRSVRILLSAVDRQDAVRGGMTELGTIADNVNGLDGAAMRGTDGAYTGAPPTAGVIADAVWDEAVAGHAAAGTVGRTLVDVLTDTDDLQSHQGDWLTATSSVRRIGVITDAHYAAEEFDDPPIYRSQALEKTAQALRAMVAAGVDLIVVLGDMIEHPETAFLAPHRAAEIANLINGTGAVLHTIPVVWCVGNHDCDHEAPAARFKTDWAEATGATIVTNGVDHAGDTIRGYVDVGDDLRVVYLDCQFDESDVAMPVTLDYGTVSASQLTWLETVLAEADAGGRCSIVVVHKPLTYGYTFVVNAADVQAILEAHDVIATLHGHVHFESVTILAENSQGEAIYQIVTPPIRQGDYTTPGKPAAFAMLEVDTAAGRVVAYSGHGVPRDGLSYGTLDKETIPQHAWTHPAVGVGAVAVATRKEIEAAGDRAGMVLARDGLDTVGLVGLVTTATTLPEAVAELHMAQFNRRVMTQTAYTFYDIDDEPLITQAVSRDDQAVTQTVDKAEVAA